MPSTASTGRFTLPLLVRELTEQSARKRTYATRVACALALFAVAFLVIYEQVIERYASDPLALIGSGWMIAEVVIGALFVGVYAIQPALTCGVITSEKERDTLSLLLITRLSPWAIVLEKLFSRLIPMATILLIALPLLTLAYALGGVTLNVLWAAVWFLAMTAFQVAALAVMCSACCRTSVSAFFSTYILGLVLFCGWPFLADLDLASAPAPVPVPGGSLELPLALFGPYYHFEARPGWPNAVMLSLPLPLSGLLFLAVAQLALTYQIVGAKSRRWTRLLAPAIGLMRRGARWFVGGSPRNAREDVPRIFRPVEWRETRNGLNRLTAQWRVGIALTILVWLLMALTLDNTHRRSGATGERMAMVHWVYWLLVLFFLCARSASVLTWERTRQTLDVLLTTPLSNHDILRQKRRPVVRMMWIAAVPFLVMIFYETVWRFRDAPSRWRDSPLYPVICLGTFAIYLPMMSWLATIVGLKSKTQMQAITRGVFVMLGWCALPFLITVPMIITFDIGPGDASAVILLLSPATTVCFNEVSELEDVGGGSPFVAFILNSMLYGGAFVFLRRYCMRNLNRLLGREDNSYSFSSPWHR